MTRHIQSLGWKVAMVAGSMLLSSQVMAESMTIIIKGGSLNTANKSQVFGTPFAYTANFEDTTSAGFGAELEFRTPTNVGFGLELLSYKNDMIYGGLPASATTVGLLVNAKKYFRVAQWLYPYVGAGLGFTGVSGSGGSLDGSASAFALQAMAGAEIRVQQFGIYAEYKLLSSRASDTAGEVVDTSGAGVFAGISLSF